MKNVEGKKLKDMILDRLEAIPDTRNSDIKLLIAIWKKYYPEKIINTPQGESVLLKDLNGLPEGLPRDESVTRLRAIIQNKEKKFIPTNPYIAKKRKWAVKEWKKLLGYSVEENNYGQIGLFNILNNIEETWDKVIDKYEKAVGNDEVSVNNT